MSSTRIAVTAPVAFDVLETARTLEAQLREIESLCQEAKSARDKNKARKKALEKQLSSLNAQLQLETAQTERSCGRLASRSLPTLPDLSPRPLDAHFHVFIDGLNRNNDTYTFASNAWTGYAVSEPTALAASAFISHPESFSDTYVFADGTRRQTALLAFDSQSDFQYTPSPPIQDLTYQPIGVYAPYDSLASLQSQLSAFPNTNAALSPPVQLSQQTTETPFSFESVYGSYYDLYAANASAVSIEGPERNVLGELHLVNGDDDEADTKRVHWNTEVTEYTIEPRKKVKMSKVGSWARGLLS
ncbi:uncharacterized protein EV420DRAFT_1761357 [Desarmillaria tabescens]|uniref:Uncharacterized protein n=1 Tax=Armillaria tabescens TaxID=1929756 RepID=A0AA39NCC4_ARMTA|nr:uncharacterized protein EV420DRAFT_1761357 [Desarmillaria tabescens]KAK0463022.1 hypothetical protein EV420DRAFT_1761357 [Desarmillaria tabescens]